MRSFTLISWFSLLVGLAAWAGIVFFYGAIQGKEEARDARLQEVEKTTQQAASAARLKALVSDTQDARASLDQLTSTEILSAVKTVEGVGKPIGVTVHIDSASPSGLVSKSGTLRTVSFALDADGTYASLIRLIQLFETFPLPAAIEQVDLYKQSGDPNKSDSSKTPWHLDLRIRLLTSAAVTS